MPWMHLQHPPENGGRKGGQGYSSQHPLVRSDNQYQEGIISKVSMCNSHIRAIFVWPWKMVSVIVCYLFYQSMDEKIKTWTLGFLAKENPNMEKALFDWPIMLQNNVKAKYMSVSIHFLKVLQAWSFFSMESALSGAFAPFVFIWQTNQSTLFLFICCCCFVCAFSSQGHTKIALLGLLVTISHYDQTCTESF